MGRGYGESAPIVHQNQLAVNLSKLEEPEMN
jgi:hypothetical protein